MPDVWGTFWIVLTGSLVGASCGLLGAYLVLRRMSLLGDALSHAVLPGIVIAFLISGSRDIVPMFVGAAVFGVLATLLIDVFHRRWQVQEDASIGIVFTALFALGVVLISIYTGQVDLDQECVLYGEIAYTPWDRIYWGDRDLGPRPVWILGGVFILNMLLVILFYKELLIASFDPELALAVGIPAGVMHYVLMGAVSVTTVASFESVGAILVVAMLIVPGATAYLWSDRLPVILGLSMGFGVLSAIGGYVLAGIWNSSIAGAMVVVLGGFFGVSLLVAPQYGLLGRGLRLMRLSLQMSQDHVLLHLLRVREGNDQALTRRADLLETAPLARLMSRLALRLLAWKGWIVAQNGKCDLASAGYQQATDLLRSHRLWETYLNQIGLPKDHVHGPADALEHFTNEQLQREMRAALPGVQTDPQGKRIPGNGSEERQTGLQD